MKTTSAPVSTATLAVSATTSPRRTTSAAPRCRRDASRSRERVEQEGGAVRRAEGREDGVVEDEERDDTFRPLGSRGQCGMVVHAQVAGEEDERGAERFGHFWTKGRHWPQPIRGGVTWHASSSRSTSTFPSRPPTTSGPSSRSSRPSWRGSSRCARWTTRISTGSPRSAGTARSGTPRSRSSIPTTASPGRRRAGRGTPGSSPSTALRTSRRASWCRWTGSRKASPSRSAPRFGMDSRRVQGDLQRFKELIEQRGAESGAWRGEVENQQD